VVADEIGVKYEDVEFRPFDDTGLDSAAGEGSTGLSRTLPMAIDAARKVRALILAQCTTPTKSGTEPDVVEVHAQFPSLKPEDLDIKEGIVFEKARPETGKRFSRWRAITGKLPAVHRLQRQANAS